MSERPFTQHSFQLYLDEQRLMGSRSRVSGALYVPPRPLCPQSHSDALDWVELSGAGTLLAYTVVYVMPQAMIDAGYDRARPYCSGIVELAEGPRVSAQIIGVDTTQPDNIAIGMPLRVAFITRGDSPQRHLAFEPAGEQ